VEKLFAALGIVLGLIIAAFFSTFGAKPNNGAKTKDSGSDVNGLPDSLRGNVEQVKDIRGKLATDRETIASIRDTTDKSIERLSNTLKLIKSTDNADGNLQDK